MKFKTLFLKFNGLDNSSEKSGARHDHTLHQAFAYKRLKSMEKVIPIAKKWLWSLLKVGHLQEVLKLL